MKSNLFLSLFIGLTLLSCKKDKDEPTPTPTPTPTAYSITSSDIASVGEQYRMAVYTVLPTDTYTLGANGQNIVWNYSNIPLTLEVDTFDFLNPATHPEVAFFTGANMYLDSPDGMQLFMNKQSDKVEITGIYTTINGETIKANLTDKWTAMKFPITYNASYQDSGYTSVNTTIPYQGNNVPGKYDITFKINSICSAEGNITTPTGTYKCVREKRMQINKFKVSIEFLGQYMQVYETVDTTYNYSFWTKDKKWNVADIKTNANDSIIKIGYLLQ